MPSGASRAGAALRRGNADSAGLPHPTLPAIGLDRARHGYSGMSRINTLLLPEDDSNVIGGQTISKIAFAQEIEMHQEQHLALSAILTGLRRAGAIDKHAVKCIVQAIEETAARAYPNCPDTADGLRKLAKALDEGPIRSCLVDVTA
jgi:hypothetical protein